MVSLMSSLYQKREVFYYQGKDQDGNRVQKSLRTKNRKIAEEKKEKLDNRLSPSTPSTLNQLKKQYLSHRKRKLSRDALAPRTVQTDQYVLDLFLRWTGQRYGTVFCDDLDVLDLTEFKKHRLQSVSPTTVGNNLRHLQSFFSYLQKNEEVEHDPFVSVSIPKSRRRDIIPSREEFKKLKGWIREQIESAENPKWIHLLMKISCHTGMRMGEIASMKWERGPEDFGTGHSRNYVYLSTSERTLTIKSKRKLRVIPVDHIWDVFERLLSRRQPSDTYVFTSPVSGEEYSVSSLCNAWKREIEKLDLSRDYTSHSIRHAVITELLRKGTPVYQVGKVVGHSSEQITERYSHFIPSDLADTMELLS